MRIAFAVDGTRGDVHPVLALGAACADRGHEVSICAPPDFQADAEARGLAFRAVGPSVRAHLEARAHTLLRGAWGTLGEGRRYFEQSVPAWFEALPEATRGADLVVGAGVALGAPSAAELHGAAYRYLIYCPALLPSAEHPPYLVPRQTLPRALNRALWRACARMHQWLLGPALDSARDRLGLGPVGDVYRHFIGERPLLAADAPLAPLPPDVPFDVDPVPCLHPFRADAPLPEKLEAFLADGEPPVYVGFGSMPDADPRTTTRALLEAFESAGCRAIVSAGWAGLGGGPLPACVLEIGPVEHAALLPRVAAVVHHGGAGTTTTAARAGVPQILVPHLMDQYYWAHRLHSLGVAPPPLSRRRFRAHRLAETLRAVLDNELMAERARELGERLRAQASLEPALARLLGDAPGMAPGGCS